ncbi:hypothetical protein C2G38_2080616 [Gigaspora rosea]|uniref:Uncharacterized protein n=1 Tax=Gigaspora rosea TaxID=44941 RepID=A0A397VEW5_9GLOM|nr:hypothetical protein C2G38_2080616 [Gigaspora rosea]
MLEMVSYKFLYFLTCLFPIVSAELQYSNMFNYGTKEYALYFTVTVILLMLMTPMHTLFSVSTFFKVTFFIVSIIFVEVIFPHIFSYMTEVFNTRTIILLSISGLLIDFLIIGLIPKKEEFSRTIMAIFFFFGLIYTCVLIYLIVIVFKLFFDFEIHIPLLSVTLGVVAGVVMIIRAISCSDCRQNFATIIVSVLLILGGIDYYIFLMLS